MAAGNLVNLMDALLATISHAIGGAVSIAIVKNSVDEERDWSDELNGLEAHDGLL
jgi:hypothetical protein